MKKTVVGIASCWLAASLPAQAADDPLNARFMLEAGWFFVSSDTRVRLDGESTQAVGNEIDFDETFGVDDVDRFRGEFLWRFATRHAIRGMYFENNRSGTRELSRDINFGDEVFPVGASVRASSELSVVQLSYDYAFLQRPNYELAGGIGIHMLDMGLGLDATISGGGGSANVSRSEDASTQAPLPVLGFRGLWKLSDKFYATAQAQYFYVDFDMYTGRVSDLKAQILWQFSPHFGVGAGYNDFRVTFEVDDTNFDGRLRWSYGGAMIFATAVF